MLILIVRSVLIYVFLLLMLRLMGKRQIGELQPFELVVTLIMADLACIPMTDPAIPILHGIVPLVTLLFLHYCLSLLTQKNLALRKFISGSAKIIINPNGIDFDILKKLNMNINDLSEALRKQGFVDYEDVLYAIAETNGTISIIPRATAEPVTSTDLKIVKEENCLPLILISGGKIVKENLVLAGVDEIFLSQQLNCYGIKTHKDVAYANLNNSGKMYIQPKYSSYIIHQADYKGGAKW